MEQAVRKPGQKGELKTGTDGFHEGSEVEGSEEIHREPGR